MKGGSMGLFVFLLICLIIGLAYFLYVVLKSKKELEKNYNANPNNQKLSVEDII